ncbi:imidazole glycerol phosphate synthase subunit hisH [Methanocella conradii HZ254]|uniref:Imidazole glycerol phosphate synthase subunit HisH n=1 Tax=Methanocella conradii (strain DSM 24694 / JCM 17849 / CGMCC 1.5162 / HZ254) TaxID=1041930 RepID=H8I512_METCZ|nr:imidazole glycerol phosphate synthase subunit HisH [Methanocella conradii]AFD01106.1 imidazole glycerol phosphate synthase subunit hisH [Methanocella conradii HZ254]MDI6897057.1 imidazole glycerol phosphate synthase subunit HisH [Methanocella conradii]
MIAIIDYGVGNLRSVEKGLAYVGARSKVTNDPSEIDSADAIVLPGVGAFESGMGQIAPLKGVILERAREGVPLLGICLGMQMLYEESEEGGQHKGLGLVKGRIARFPESLKVPHMGWNSLSIKKRHRLLNGIKDGSYVYFVHSYRAPVGESTVAATDYGGDFTAIVAEDNVVGTQFHPEKSGETGLRMLKNFAEMA